MAGVRVRLLDKNQRIYPKIIYDIGVILLIAMMCFNLNKDDSSIVSEMVIEGDSKKIDERYGRILVGKQFLDPLKEFPAECLEIEVKTKFKNKLGVKKVFNGSVRYPYVFERLGDFAYLVSPVCDCGYFGCGRGQYKFLMVRFIEESEEEIENWTYKYVWRFPKEHYPYDSGENLEDLEEYGRDMVWDCLPSVLYFESTVDKNSLLHPLLLFLNSVSNEKNEVTLNREFFDLAQNVEHGTFPLERKLIIELIKKLADFGTIKLLDEKTLWVPDLDKSLWGCVGCQCGDSPVLCVDCEEKGNWKKCSKYQVMDQENLIYRKK